MSLRVSLPVCFALGSAVGAPGPVAQQPVTRAQAVEAALARGARAALGRADTAFAAGALRTARARLSRRTARDADSLLTMARLRREVGDVSELDVRLAEVNAGQLENVAVDDSLAALDALLAVQFVMGRPADVPTITLSDSLVPTETTPVDTTGGGDPLPVVAAAATLRSAERTLTFAHRSVFAAPTIQVGFERGDPTVPAGTVLPTFGVSWPFPLFNWNGGET